MSEPATSIQLLLWEFSVVPLFIYSKPEWHWDRALYQDGDVHFSIPGAQNHGLSLFLSFCERNNNVCCADPSGRAQHALFVMTPPPTPSIPLRSEFPYGWGGSRMCLEQHKIWQKKKIHKSIISAKTLSTRGQLPDQSAAFQWKPGWNWRDHQRLRHKETIYATLNSTCAHCSKIMLWNV